jgi:hypothetical protein
MACADCDGLGGSGSWHRPLLRGSDDKGTTAALIDFEIEVSKVMDEARRIMVGRQKDYGPYNIARAWPDPTTALIVRITDKLERLKNLHGKDDTFGERVRDSWIDLSNYGIVGVMVTDRTWPGLGDTHE